MKRPLNLQVLDASKCIHMHEQNFYFFFIIFHHLYCIIDFVLLIIYPDCLCQSKLPIIQHLLSSENAINTTLLTAAPILLKKSLSQRIIPQKLSLKPKKKSSSLSAVFSKDLQGLISKLKLTRCHFVRCIKSNSLLQPQLFDREMLTTQVSSKSGFL